MSIAQGYRSGTESTADEHGCDLTGSRVSGACQRAAPRMAFVGGRGPRVRPMFRNRDRMVKVMVIVVSAAMVLALVLPFLALLGN